MPASRQHLRTLFQNSSALVGPGLVSMCALLLPALAAHAQEGPQQHAHDHAPARSQDAPVTELPPVVVRPMDGATFDSSAAGLLRERDFIPASATVISGRTAADETLRTSNSAELMTRIPDGAMWNAGGVSGLPAMNGMGGAGRVQISINDMLFGMACPNDMNPGLSYVNPAMIAAAQIYMGTAPVSVGGDYTGAKVDVAMAPPVFSPGQAFTTSGSVAGFYRSNGNSSGVDATVTVSNAETSLTYTGGWARAGNYTSGNGTTIKSTMYETQNHALSVSKKSGDHLFTAQVGGQFIPSQGYPNEYMDMVENKSLFANARYEGAYDWGKLEASLFANRVRHTMGFIEPDKTGDMPMDTRGTDLGYSIKGTLNLAEGHILRLGNELFYSGIDDWWPPVDGSMMMGPDTFWSINDGRRTRLGTFAEWEREIDSQWTALLGLRNDTVWMNTGDVEGYNAMMYGADAARFNAQNHARTFFNMDGTATLRYQPDAASTYELAFARKTRAPNFYELYAWSTNAMAMNMIGWFGDGNGYVGNLDLDAESAHTVSFTATWKDPAQQAWELRVTPYYSYVVDYIDVDRCAIGSCLTNQPNNLTVRDDFVFLQFANHDAWMYGVNIDGTLEIWNSPASGKGTFRGSLNFVQGQRTDGVNLYNIMPLNGLVALDHRLGNWTTSAELVLVGAKTQVSQVHNQVPTVAYALVNLRASYVWQQFKVDFAIENLLDTEYDLPLGGANLVNDRQKTMMGTSPVWGQAVAGPGRSFNTRVSWTF